MKSISCCARKIFVMVSTAKVPCPLSFAVLVFLSVVFANKASFLPCSIREMNNVCLLLGLNEQSSVWKIPLCSTPMARLFASTWGVGLWRTTHCTYIVVWKTLTNEIKLVHESEQHGLLVDVIPPHVVDQLLLQDTRRLQSGP